MTASEDLERTLRRVVLRMVLADGRIAASEITRVRWVLLRALGGDPGEATVREELDQLADEPRTLTQMLAQAHLDEASAGRVLRAAFFIATADGTVDAAEDALLVAIARALDIDPQRYRHMLRQFVVARELK
jgi:uncharacterized tellurite resistance protein B-like protein